MKKALRLTKNLEFINVYKSGRRISSPFFVMYIKKNDLGYSRLGVSVSKKVGKSVVRNKIKRQIKEIIRKNYDFINSGWDIVFSVKPAAVQLNYAQIEKEIISLLKRGRIYNDKKAFNLVNIVL
ncbi:MULTISPECIES: ribonuclease P protein component [Tepidanaerobacter]|uniref:Ribonuclease P protein component n=1 Tax=Tepidanaerobacter syntrophicus TaxID=224999 RepID=A0A0U9HLA6_9FIRM|nr:MULTISPECIES: ribonuclease P protein component [Tepidanaerobacter]GAQ24863.1 ribonuclease P protein component [Tepidanaerobacter syntrophicus]GLI18869.1 ribonuclease P protein component [Tepidanaerobacter syntrophicus]GLI51275.1 ribonuclease P protein component [Tepidanaerobacter syntrophicus]HHV83203.1 ribonuclease P protein component [Tepidanaerobacter syntrophicus]